MKVTWSKSHPVKQFADVDKTDCFTVPDEDGVFVNRVYMKIDAYVSEAGTDFFNAVTLTNGELTWFDPEGEVYPLDAELRVNDFMPS